MSESKTEKKAKKMKREAAKDSQIKGSASYRKILTNKSSKSTSSKEPFIYVDDMDVINVVDMNDVKVADITEYTSKPILLAQRNNLGSTIQFKKNITNSMRDAIGMGMYSFQIFLGGRMSTNRSIVSEADIESTLELQSSFPMNINSHLPYVYNLCGNATEKVLAWSGDIEKDLYTKKCLKSIEYELDIFSNFSNDCGCGGCVIHLGCWKTKFRCGGKKKKAEKYQEVVIPEGDNGIEAAVKSLSQIKFGEGSRLLLENMTGGGKLCKNIGEMAKIWSLVDNKENIGFCIDTCHLFAEGNYDIGDIDDIDRFFMEFDKHIGVENIGLIHLNDSRAEYGSCVDKHMGIGGGYIWGKISIGESTKLGEHSKKNRMNALTYFMDKTKKIPTVLETHPSDYSIIQSY